MTHLVIRQQTGQQPELINWQILEVLAQMLPSLDNQSNIIGSVRLDHAYEDTCTTLRTAFEDFIINVTNNDYYIRFQDSATQQICATQWGTNSNISLSQAAAVTEIPTGLFYEADITSFDELRLFGGNAGVRIGWNAFNKCRNLQSIDLTNVTYMVRECFKQCDSLAIDVNMPRLSSIDTNGYQFDSSGVTSVSNLGSVTIIPTLMFSTCANLISVTLPSTCTTIGPYAFQYCSSLQEVNGLGSVTSIDNGAFYRCSALAIDVNMPNLTSIGRKAFHSSGITSVSNLGSITSLDGWDGYDDGTFARCANLTSVTLPNTLTKIYADVFANCTSLQYLEGTSNVNQLDNTSLAYCTSLGIVHFENVTTLSGSSTFKQSNIKQLYLSKVTITRSWSNWHDQITYASGIVVGATIKLLYLKDIQTLHAGDFSRTTMDALVINNTTVPTVNSFNDMSPSDSGYNSNEYAPSNIFRASTITAIYVPDTAVSAYQSDSIFGTKTILPISQLNKVATRALYDALPDGQKDTTLIEEYM